MSIKYRITVIRLADGNFFSLPLYDNADTAIKKAAKWLSKMDRKAEIQLDVLTNTIVAGKDVIKIKTLRLSK